jgi:cytoskeletal protein RodZ
MNTQKRILNASACLLFSLFLIPVLFSGCKKDGPTKAVITVNDSLGRPAFGAVVTLWQDTAVNVNTGASSNIRVSKTTDSSGKVEFEFQLECFLNLEAYKNNDTVRGFVRLEQYKTVYQTVNF